MGGRLQFVSPTYRETKKLLKATGLPWRLEPASKHILIYLNGEKIGVLCNGAAHGTDAKQVKSAIKRYVESHGNKAHT